MDYTRREERKPEKLQLLLSRMAEPLLTEHASTDNVSSHGMRVRTDRAWKQDTHLIVQSSEFVLWGRGKVIYCQALPDRTFASWTGAYGPDRRTGLCRSSAL